MTEQGVSVPIKAASWTSFVTSILSLAVVGLLGIVRSQDVHKIEELEADVAALQATSSQRTTLLAQMRAYMVILCEQGCDTRAEVYQLRDDVLKGHVLRKECTCPRLDLVELERKPVPRIGKGGG